MERDSVGNAVAGTVSGSVVQAGTIQQVVLPAQVQQGVLPLPVPRQLPPAVGDFTGRGAELAVLDGLLPTAGNCGAAAIAVVDGAAGTGKTALVVRWAHRMQRWFPDGTLFANLRGFGPSAPLNPAVVLSLFLPALGVAESQIPPEFDAQVGLFRSVLATRRVLVVLDNAAGAEQVRPLLPGTTGSVLVMTSRNSLTDLVVGEGAHRISLDMFTPPESRMLLREVVGSGRVDAEPNSVAELVEACGGLPLAVRVAATRIAARPLLTIADAVGEIIDVTKVPGGGEKVSGAVRSVFDWSYVRLSAEQAMVFRRLGLHPSTEFGIPAMTVSTGLDATRAHHCAEVLAELHLVVPVGRRRYRMHDLVHAYAAHRAHLDDGPETCRETVGRMVRWYARTARNADRVALPSLDAVVTLELAQVEPEIAFETSEDAVAWLNDERANLVTATSRAAELELHDAVVVLATSSRFLTARSRSLSLLYLDEFSARGVAAARSLGNRAVEAFLLSQRGGALCYVGRLEDADTALARALTLAEQMRDRAEQVFALSGLGRVRTLQNRLGAARSYYQQALPLAAGLDGGRAEAVVRCNLSQICTQLGEYRQALDHADRELVLRRRSGDQVGAAYACYDAALAWQGLGHHDTAISLFQRTIEAYRAIGSTGSRFVDPLLAQATSLEHIGNTVAAGAVLRDAVEVLAELEDPRAADVRQRLADVEAVTDTNSPE